MITHTLLNIKDTNNARVFVRLQYYTYHESILLIKKVFASSLACNQTINIYTILF